MREFFKKAWQFPAGFVKLIVEAVFAGGLKDFYIACGLPSRHGLDWEEITR